MTTLRWLQTVISCVIGFGYQDQLAI